MNLVSNKEVYKNGKIVLTEKVYRQKNRKLVRVSLSLGKSAVLVIPISEKNKLYLTKQRIRETGKTILQFPSGGIEGGESAIRAATRELSEELGLEGQMIFLGKMRPFYTLVNLEVNVFLCKRAIDNSKNTKLKQEFYESIEKKAFSEAKLYDLIKKGQIRDSYTLGALSILRAYGNIYN